MRASESSQLLLQDGYVLVTGNQDVNVVWYLITRNWIQPLTPPGNLRRSGSGGRGK